jgi:tetratricopeptide (TPR) repeat protein
MRRACLVALYLIAIPLWSQETQSLGDAARKIRDNKQNAAATAETAHEGSLQVSLPGKPWAVAVDAAGFAVEQDLTKPDGRRYLFASNKNTSMNVSITLERSPKGADASGCPGYLRQRIKSLQGFTVSDVRYSTAANMATVEYLIPQAGGVPVRQKSLVACTAKDDVFIDIHLSKTLFKPEDAPLFATLLDAVHIVSAPAALQGTPASDLDSRQYFETGSRYYLQERYREAIEPYSNALELEKRNPKLEHNLWRVLVDNLGMAYGITGDLNSAEATFRYGLSKDATYPMFFYNMACVYGERNDLENALLYLNKTYEFRANSIPGEGLPDPRKDDSFKRFLNNPKFQAVADTFARGK